MQQDENINLPVEQVTGLQYVDSLQGGDESVSNGDETSISQPPLSYTALIGHLKDWGPSSQWDDTKWNVFKKYFEDERPTGEELMNRLSYKRRDKVENLFYKLSEREKKFYLIRWENDYSKGERSLPALRTTKEGLRISYKQLEKLGLKLHPNTYCKMKKISDDEFTIKFFVGNNQ